MECRLLSTKDLLPFFASQLVSELKPQVKHFAIVGSHHKFYSMVWSQTELLFVMA